MPIAPASRPLSSLPLSDPLAPMPGSFPGVAEADFELIQSDDPVAADSVVELQPTGLVEDDATRDEPLIELEPNERPTTIYGSPHWAEELDRAAASAEGAATARSPSQASLSPDPAPPRAARAPASSAASPPSTLSSPPPPSPSSLPSPPSLPASLARPPSAPAPTPAKSGNTVVTHVGLPPKRPSVSQEQPSIVLAPDMEAAETASIRPRAGRTSGTGPAQADASGVDLDVSFTEGPGSDSLIIDFDAELDEPPSPGEVPAGIRPAAQPMGKRVVPAIAQTRRPSGAREPDEEANDPLAPGRKR